MDRCLTIQEEITINQFSQGIYTLEDMTQWFLKYEQKEKKTIIHGLLSMVIQAGATADDIETAALKTKRRRSDTAVKLLNPRKPFQRFGAEICDLPEGELLNGYCILLVALSIADIRRKLGEPAGTCTHWWHKDLSDKEFIKSLIQRYG